METDTTVTLDGTPKTARSRRNPRGVFQKIPGKNSSWWIRYIDAQGHYRREKAGTWGSACKLYNKRKNEALQGRKLPETLRKASVSFAEIARDTLEYSRATKVPGGVPD
jgi:hypothetical protein